MTNDGTLIAKAKEVKGGFPISNIFLTERSHVEIAIATKSEGLRYKGYKINFVERFTQELDESGYYSKGTNKFSVMVDHPSANVYMNLSGKEFFIITNDFDEANEFFKMMVSKYDLDNDCYLTNRYIERTTNTHKKFDYLTFLREESKSL